MNSCQLCGHGCDLSFRFCPRCGAQMYLSLAPQSRSVEDFLPLLNSLYNLLAVKRGEGPHPERRKYLPAISESVMARRSQIEHEEDIKKLFMLSFKQPGANSILMDLYTLSLSNALAGYVYRTVEEMICERRTPPLSRQEKAIFLKTMQNECGSDLTDSEYRVLREQDATDNRLLFCLAVRWDNRQLKYMLANEATHRKWLFTLFAQNAELSENCFEQVYRSLGMLRGNRALDDGAKEMIHAGLEQDLIHGYIVKLVESLDPL